MDGPARIRRVSNNVCNEGEMKRLKFGRGVLLPLILGLMLGGLGATVCFFPQGLSIRNWQQEFKQGHSLCKRVADVAEQNHWPPREFSSACNWTYLKVDESGWSTEPVGTFQDLDDRLGRLNTPSKEIVIPIFPSVYGPQIGDKLYYDAILESRIEQGDKVLVIGTGSGADAWVAWTKTRSLVYVVEINPMAVVNAKITARLGDFQIKPIAGDIRDVKLPDDFGDFDLVLWNMPYVETGARIEKLADRGFHDGDDGSILKSFLALLPSLLKKDGKAIVLNSAAAEEFITCPGVTKKTGAGCTLFVIPNS